MRPYYEDLSVTIYHGDCREILPQIGLTADAIIADPPYAETSLAWDKWPEGWPEITRKHAPHMWCFGSLRMFFSKWSEFSGWKHAQEVVWEKHNGSGFAKDRFKRVHEFALHFYQGAWGDLYRNPPTFEGEPKLYKRRTQPPHTGAIGGQEAEVRTKRIMRSVIYHRSCHGYAQNETQKPEGIVRPLVEYAVPTGGLLIDLFTGSGTALKVAKDTGRKAIGFDVREQQCEVAANRVSKEEKA